ncbi:MAG: hypothetical protein KGL39_57630 [Patescibacteria group bacterium]|nr:hypothetical protein [Patescibacteria group bacterium]
MAIRRKLCWICGQRLDPTFAFVLGPMCMVNRVNAEPPNHLDCARFAAMACPFLTKPRMKRNERDVPDEAQDMPGLAIKRNPGCCVVWLTNGYSLFDAGNGQLFEIGKPLAIEFYAEGRKATREEVLESIRTGLPILREVAEQDGREAVAELEQAAARAVALVPA